MNYLEIISDEFQARVESNPSYSLRAFARDLLISPSRLSEILNGKGGLSQAKATVVASKLGLVGSEIHYFKALVDKEHGRSSKIKDRAAEYLKQRSTEDNFKSLSIDSFKVISDWYHFAILSAMELDSFDGTALKLSKELGLDLKTTKDSLKRLERLELVEKVKSGYSLLQNNLKTTHEVSSFALKRSHKQTLKQAIDSLDKVAIDQRDITSMTMAIDLEKLPEAKEKIKNFRREMSEFLESESKNAVYNINIQLVPLSMEIGE